MNYAHVAQTVEHFLGKEEVTGSSPVVGLITSGEKMKDVITLACTECKQRNYTTYKDKKKHQAKIELKKYCRFCRVHTLHKEIK